MSINYLDYCQYLLSSQINYTLTNFAAHIQEFSHDTINRYLNSENLTPEVIWEKVHSELQSHPEACLVFDDTVLDKRFSSKIELVRRQYSGNEHRVIRGIGLISCIYVNPETGSYSVIDYRIYDPDGDGHTKLDHVADMLNDVVFKKKIPVAKVLMDSWYAAQKLMALIDNLGKIYYVPLKKNRLVDDTGGQKKYQPIEQLIWSEIEEKQGKLIKINKFPSYKKVKLFRVTVSANRTEYVATNDLNQSSIDEVISECKLRWKIEEFHREIKQLTGIESCQCRKASVQKNHIACALLVWVFLTRMAKKVSQTVYQLKAGLLADYLSQELKHPSLKLSFI
ncbi:IS701 family transposase [Planktothrix paucivesiculata]|nr:transposase [Planktothrix paucivesiculata]